MTRKKKAVAVEKIPMKIWKKVKKKNSSLVCHLCLILSGRMKTFNKDLKKKAKTWPRMESQYM